MDTYHLDLFDVESGSDQQQLELERIMFENQMGNLLEPVEEEENAGSRDLLEQSQSDDDTQDTRQRGSGSSSCSNRKRKFSKNLLSERRRRQKLNEKLYSLRAIVPKITKMDKASIMADAIGYVEELKSQVSQLRQEITAIEEDLSNRSPNSSLTTASPSSEYSPSPDDDHHHQLQQLQQHCSEQQQKDPNRNIVSFQMDVEKLDECRTCLVRFRCCPDLLADIVATLESLDLEVLGASVNTFEGQIFTTYMAKVRDERLMHKDKLEGIVSSAVLDSKLRI